MNKTYIVEKQEKQVEEKLLSSLSEVSLTSLKEGRSILEVIATSVNLLEQEFDDDAGEELDLRRDIDEREVMTCEVEPSLLADVEVTGSVNFFVAFCLNSVNALVIQYAPRALVNHSGYI